MRKSGILMHVSTLPGEYSCGAFGQEARDFIDLLADYYVESGLLDQEPDADGCVDIDTEAIAEAIAQRAHKEKSRDFSPEDLIWVVQGELQYGEEAEE